MPYGPFPGVELEFDLNANPVDDANHALSLDAAVAPISSGITAAGATDLFVISHGWNNDKQEARALYSALFATAQALVNAGTVKIPAARKLFVVAVLWPSARFVDASEIPGGAAAALDPAILVAQGQLEVLRAAFEGDATAQASIDAALAAAATLDTDQGAASAFVDALNALPSSDAEEHDSITTAVSSAVAAAQQTGSGSDPSVILASLATLPPPNAPPAATGTMPAARPASSITSRRARCHSRASLRIRP